jgi:hypothetical protein
MDCAGKIVEGSLASLALVSRAVETRGRFGSEDEAALIEDGAAVESW